MATLSALSAVVEERDPYARGHASRVAVLAHSLARRIGFDHDRIARLRTGAVLHDIGKITVPREVLVKPGPLDAGELMHIRRHPTAGARILRAVGAAPDALPCVLYHHERWDGAGYPSRRAQTEIPLEARILAVADSFDAMTTNRPYRAALPADQALAELQRCAGTQFDPDLVEAFRSACYEGDLGWDDAIAV
jgi:putative nucleotidyltransferase with HDIG domain